jgi:hypothetical protein
MLRTKRDNRLSNRKINTSLMALGKIWLKKWQSLKKKQKEKACWERKYIAIKFNRKYFICSKTRYQVKNYRRDLRKT